MKRQSKLTFFMAVSLILALSSCVEHRYYREHRYHTQRYYHHHHRPPPPGVHFDIHN